MNTAGATQIAAMQNKAAEIEQSWPSDYSELTDAVYDMIAIQPTQPTSEDTKIWINTTNQQSVVQVPTYEELTELSSAISADEKNGFDGFITVGIPTMPYFSHMYPLKTISGGAISDSAVNFLVFDIAVTNGWRFHLSDYTTYKFYLKVYVSSNWADYKQTWFMSDYTFTENVSRISVYIRRRDGGNLSQTDIDAIMFGFKIINDNNNVSDSVAKMEFEVADLQTIVGGSHYEENLFAFKKTISSDGTLNDNNKICLIYPIDAIKGAIIGLSSYSTYKICYKTYSASWSGASAWQTKNVFVESPARYCLYITRKDNEDLSAGELADIKALAFCDSATSLSHRVSVIEENSEYTSISYGTDFINNYVPSSPLSLPTEFDGFPIAINISRSGKVYGHDLVPSMFRKNDETNGATYYVSPDGSNTNDGISPSTPLKTIGAAIGKSDVNTIILLPGTYINGTHFASAITKEVNIIGIGTVVLKSASSDTPLKFQSGCYVENIIFDGGTSACATELANDICVFVRCAFINSGSANGLTAKGGYYVLFDCVADNNYLDGFNYHSNNSTYLPQVVEIRCKGRLDGDRADSVINNGSTCHESGGRIIRIGCEYSSCRGCVIADADGACSVNIACIASSTESSTENRNGNYGSLGSAAKMWLYDCVSFGSPYDIIADTGTIRSTVTYLREKTVNGGYIARLS